MKAVALSKNVVSAQQQHLLMSFTSVCQIHRQEIFKLI